MWTGLKVLVTGGTGFIGSHLTRRLAAGGARVRATYFSRPPQVILPQVEHIQADLRHPEDCAAAVADMDAVFICAAVTSGAGVIRNTPLVHITPNVVMNTLLMDAAYQAGVKRVLFISSGAAYPPAGNRPLVESEMFAGEPADVYYGPAWMKRHAETLCRTYAEKIANPMQTVIVRPSNVYGPGDKFDPATSHVTAALIRKVAERHAPLEVWGSGHDVRDLIYIDDLIEGMLRAFAHPAPHLAVNLCSGQGHSVREILHAALDADGYADAPITFNPSKPSTDPIRLFSPDFAKQSLGFAAQVSLAKGLRETLAWFHQTWPQGYPI